jgi:hypothetical protein
MSCMADIRNAGETMREDHGVDPIRALLPSNRGIHLQELALP